MPKFKHVFVLQIQANNFQSKWSRTLFRIDCSASTAFLDDRFFSSSSRRCLSILMKLVDIVKVYQINI
jgi:hypothetical protein